MFSYKTAQLTLALLGLALLPGCLHSPDFKINSVTPLQRKNVQYKETIRSVAVKVKELSEDEVDALFDGYGHKINSHGIRPVQIAVRNTSSEIWVLAASEINLRLTNTQEVMDILHNSPLYKGLGLFFGSNLTFGVIGSLFPASLPAMTLISLSTPFISHRESAKIAAENTQREHDLENQALTDIVHIYPGQTINTLIFVTKYNYRSLFNITLLNKKDYSSALVFKVKL